MSAYYGDTITLGGLTLNIVSATPKRVPSTRKQLIGKSLKRIEIPGRNMLDWEIVLSGLIYGATMETDRDSLEALQNNQDKNGYAYVDGTHDGTYYIDGSIEFQDIGEETATIFRYTITIIEKNQ